jgi:hypothetical protein
MAWLAKANPSRGFPYLTSFPMLACRPSLLRRNMRILIACSGCCARGGRLLRVLHNGSQERSNSRMSNAALMCSLAPNTSDFVWRDMQAWQPQPATEGSARSQVSRICCPDQCCEHYCAWEGSNQQSWDCFDRNHFALQQGQQGPSAFP